MTHTIPTYNGFLRVDGRIWPRGNPDPHPKAPQSAVRAPTSSSGANTAVPPSEPPRRPTAPGKARS